MKNVTTLVRLLLLRRDGSQLLFGVVLAAPLALMMEAAARPVSTADLAMMVTTPLLVLAFLTRVALHVVPFRRGKTVHSPSTAATICAWSAAISLVITLTALGSAAVFAWFGPERSVGASLLAGVAFAFWTLVSMVCLAHHAHIELGRRRVWDTVTEIEDDLVEVVEEIRDRVQEARPPALRVLGDATDLKIS